MELTVEFIKGWLKEPDLPRDEFTPVYQMTPCFPFKQYTDKDLMRILINACCPVVCEERDEPNSWHDSCIRKAIGAFLILRGRDGAKTIKAIN